MVKSYQSSYEVNRVKLVADSVPKGSLVSLDIACSIGLFSKIMLDKGHSVTGIDADKDNIEFAKEKYKDCEKLFFLNHDIDYFMRHNTSTYDFILALEIVEHLIDYNKFIGQCYSLLKKNGRLIISTPNKFSLEAIVGTYWAMRKHEKYCAWDHTHKRFLTHLSLRNY